MAASFAMDVVQDGFAAAFEPRRTATLRDEEVEAVASVVAALERFAPAVFRPGRGRTSGRLVHYALGCAFAAAYVAAQPRVPALAALHGAAFGAALFVAADRVLIPGLRLGRPWADYTPAEKCNALVSHVAYGMTLELARERYAARRRSGDVG